VSGGGRTALLAIPGAWTNEHFDGGQQALNVMHGSSPAWGDGRRSDHQALGHWLDTARDLGGHRVYLPPGVYRLEQPVGGNGHDRVLIQGAGRASILQPEGYDAATGEAHAALDLSDVDDLVLHDLCVDGAAQAAPRLGWVYGTNPTSQGTTLYIYPNSSLQAGDEVYIGSPEFLPAFWERNQIVSIQGAVSTGAIKVTLAQALAHQYGGSTRIATIANAYGGHGLRVRNARRLTLRNCTFTGLLGNGLDLHGVEELLVDGCRFERIGQAQVDSFYWAATAFGIGGYDVSKARITNSVFRDILGRRSAGIEVRSTVEAQDASIDSHRVDMLDWVIAHNTFDTIGGQSDVFTSHGAGVNLVCGNYPTEIRRVVIEANTSAHVGDGHFWIAMPGGLVTVVANAMEHSIYGPFLNINAPRAVITDNAMRTGGLSGIEVDAISTGQYSQGSGSNTPGSLDLAGGIIAHNDISDLIHAQSGTGIVLTTTGVTLPAAAAPRQWIIAHNRINGCRADGIVITQPLGDILIAQNIILDVNQGTLGSTQLNGASVSAPNGPQQLTVASTAGFVPIGFCQIGPTQTPTTLVGATLVGATSFVVASAASIAVGHALWLGVEEANTAEIVVPTSVAGTTIGCAPLTLAHANGVNVSGTYRPQVVSIDSPTQLTVQYNQGVWADNTPVTNPFPGVAGINIQGSATFPAARVRITGNRVGQDTVGTTQWGVLVGSGVPGPLFIKDNDFTGCVLGDVRTVAGLAAYIDNPVAGGGGAGVQVGSAQFTESTGAGTYTGSVVVPAGATILDIVLTSSAVWNAFTSATMQVGDGASANGWYTGVNLKAGGDLPVGDQISFNVPQGKQGVYLDNATGVRQGYSATARTISGMVTTVGATGNQGRTRMLVEYVLGSPQDAVKG
jgi:hypothetical protein